MDTARCWSARLSFIMQEGRVSIERLERAAEIAANLVDKYGDAYWPFLERIDREISNLKKREKVLTAFRARKSNRGARR